MCFGRRNEKYQIKRNITVLMFYLAGIVYYKVTRPDHLNDLLTLPSNNKGAKPKSVKNQKKSQNKQKPAKAEEQVPDKFQK